MLVRRGNIVIAACHFRARKDEFFAFLRSIPRCYKSVSSALNICIGLPNPWVFDHHVHTLVLPVSKIDSPSLSALEGWERRS